MLLEYCDSFVIHIKPKVFTKILLMVSKNGLTHLTVMKMIKEFAGLRAKTWAYLMDDDVDK